MLGGPIFRLGIPKERLSIPPGTGWGGKDTGWLATCECPLRTDSACWKSLESFLQWVSFSNSRILPVCSRIVSRSSVNFLFENLLTLDSWNRFNSSISLRLLMSLTEIPILLLLLFMKKLLILSASFVSLMSTTNFFFLRLDRFIQLLNTSSAVISLEFVFSNLCLTVSENLLSLSIQLCPNLFTLRIVSLSFLGARHKSANNRFHRSIMTDWRRQTGRQAFFFRVIGSSSARMKERLTDGDVIVVEVIKDLLLAKGLLGVFDISLCNEVVVGLITCGGVVLGQGAKVLSGSTQGIYPRYHGSWRCRAAGIERWSERWWGRRWSERKSRRCQKQRSQCGWNMKMTMGWTEIQTWATVCVHLNKENSQGKMTLTDNKEERLRKNEGSSMHDDSCIGINYAHRFPKCFKSLHTLLGFSLCTSCRQFNCCRCTN